MTRFLQCGSIVLLGLLLLYPPGKAAASDVGVRIVKDLLDQLWDYQSGQTEGKKHVGFDVPEILVNQYIAYLIDSKTRLGMKAATIKITGKNKVDIDCDIDLNQIRRWSPTVIKLDPLLADKDDLKVLVTATADITNGIATVSLLSARDTTGSISLDTIKALFRVVARKQPENFDIDNPIKLPFDLSVAMVDGVFYGKTPRKAPK
jgi:hypothetical protein